MPATEPLSIRQLEVLVALTDLRSFTKAAQHLALSQSTVSGHIADLEARLALRLVNRDRSGVKPTPAGEAVLRHARDALRAEQNARMAAAEVSGLMAGELVVGASTIPAVYMIPAHITSFRERNPGIALQMRTGDSRDIVDWVTHGEIDAGITGATPPAKGLWSETIGGDELVLVCAPGHAFAERAEVSVRDVLDEPMVMREPGSGTRAAMLDELKRMHSKGSPHVALEVGSTEAAKAAVRAGVGVSFVSSLSARDEAGAGWLAIVPVRDFEVRRAFHLVTRDEARLGPATRAFRDGVLARVRARS